MFMALGLPGVAFSAEKTNLPAGFIALSESPMNWADANAWCQQQGGRLPRINNSDAWDRTGAGEATIEGFGKLGRPWPAGLPYGGYWTGTERSTLPGATFLVLPYNGGVTFGDHDQTTANRVVCVPCQAERP